MIMIGMISLTDSCFIGSLKGRLKMMRRSDNVLRILRLCRLRAACKKRGYPSKEYRV